MWKIMTFAMLCSVSLPSALLAQQSLPQYETHGHCEDGLPNYKAWFSSTDLPAGKPYVADVRRKERVIESYPKLKLQMTLAQVEGFWGPPDFSAPRASGHLSNDPHPPPTVCSDQVAYVLKKTGENMTDMNDVAVYLFFSPEGKLTWAAPQNLPNLHELGGSQR